MNNKIIIAVIIIVIAVLGGYFLLKNSAYKVPTPTAPIPTPETPSAPTTETPFQETTSPPTTQTPSNQNIVTYTDSGYSPSSLTVKKGETVVFQNNSSQSMWTASAVHPTHTVYSGTSLSEHCGTPAEATAFDACQGILPGNSWSFKFDKVGTWKYHNHLNPGHTGTIIVVE